MTCLTAKQLDLFSVCLFVLAMDEVTRNAEPLNACQCPIENSSLQECGFLISVTDQEDAHERL
jgi:hypothetical protein